MIFLPTLHEVAQREIAGWRTEKHTTTCKDGRIARCTHAPCQIRAGTTSYDHCLTPSMLALFLSTRIGTSKVVFRSMHLDKLRAQPFDDDGAELG